MTRSTTINFPVLHLRPACRNPLVAWLTLLTLGGCGSDTGTGPAGPPAGIGVVIGNNQVGSVGAAVPHQPSVRVFDANGNGVAGVSVRFDVISGGGVVTGDSAATDSEGRATVGEWRLGPLPQVNILRAQTIDHPFQVSFEATAGVGAPSSLQVVNGGANLAAIVGEEVLTKPTVRVRDAFGNPIPNAQVTWSIVAGNGTIIGPTTTTTDAEGRTSVGGWRLGTTSGINQLRARTANGIVATFFANGIGIPASIEAASPTQQDGYMNFAVPLTARAKVRDAQGGNVAFVPVVFEMTSGTGSIIGDTVITDVDGIAALGDWKLGASGFSQVTATVPGFGGSTVFTATGVARAFTIDIRFVSTPPPDLRDAYVAGALRWMEVIVGDLPNHTVNRAAGPCFGLGTMLIPTVNETVDDVIIYARIAPYDGPGNVLAQAGTCGSGERPGNFLSVLGGMDFDSDDAQNLLDKGQFTAVVTHEMGHVLGMHRERYDQLGLITGNGGLDPYFTGSAARAAWPVLGIAFAGNLVPLEDLGGLGTRYHHWRESVLTDELMTGIISSPGVPMPLTAVTVGAMADLGYDVDVSAADAFIPSLQAQGDPADRVVIREQIFSNGQRVN